MEIKLGIVTGIETGTGEACSCFVFYVILNPDTVVFNSELLQLFPDVENKIKTNLKSSISNYSEFYN